jgi:hypothetical protein
VLSLYRRGIKQPEELSRILSQSGPSVSVQSIRADLRAIRKRITASYAADPKNRQAMIAEELDEIDQLMREAWLHYERSRHPAVRMVTKSAGPGAEPKTERHEEPQAGDLGCLNLIENLIARRENLLGLSAVAKSQIQAAETENALNIVQLMRLADEMVSAEIVSGPPLLQQEAVTAASAPAEEDADLREAMIVSGPALSGNGNGHATVTP